MKPDMIKGFDVYPFVNLFYNSHKAVREWPDRVTRARSLHHKAEYLTVVEGLRPCATIHLNPQDYDVQIERLTKDGLVWLPIQRTKKYSGFAHQHYPVQQMDMNSSVYGVLAKRLEDAEAFRKASNPAPGKATDHETIGKLLGFPECCAKYFTEVFPKYVDPVFQSAERTSSAEWINDNEIKVKLLPETNQMLRYAGFRLGSHFPCSLDCEGTKETAKIWIQAMEEIDKEGLKDMMDILSLPGKWSVMHGVAIVETEPFTVLANSMATKERWTVSWEVADEQRKKKRN